MPGSQLRIAMLSTHSCPTGNLGARDTGGMSVYIRELAMEMGKRGLIIDIYTRRHDQKEGQIVELGRNVRLIHLKAGEGEGIHRLAVYPHLPEFACNLENFRRNNGLQYDLVFSHYWLSGWVGNYLQGWWRMPHVIMFHTLGAAKNAVGIGEEEPELRLQTEAELAKSCRLILAATEEEKRDIIRYCAAEPDSIAVIPCGVNLSLFRPVNKAAAKRELSLDGDKVILFVGRIEPLKGVDQLLRAMPYLRNSHKPRLLVIGGDEQSRDEIERLGQLSRDLHMQDSVSFLGTVSQEKLPGWYSAADVCVIPSYYETFCLVALESIACGTPLVATDVGGAKGFIHQGQTGYVVTDNNPECLAGKISLVLSQPTPDLQMANAVRASVTGFSWSNIAEMVIERFHCLISGNERRGYDRAG